MFEGVNGNFIKMKDQTKVMIFKKKCYVYTSFFGILCQHPPIHPSLDDRWVDIDTIFQKIDVHIT